MTRDDWTTTTDKCPYCEYPDALYSSRRVQWTMHVPWYMGDEEYETATRYESMFECPACGEQDAEPATY